MREAMGLMRGVEKLHPGSALGDVVIAAMACLMLVLVLLAIV